MADGSRTFKFNLRMTEGANALNQEENLFEAELGRVLSWIERHVADLNRGRGPSNVGPRNKHDGILISGSRGSGKSTFMLSLRDRMSGDQKNGKDPLRIACLDTLDPTLIDGDDVFLATITARILRFVKEKKRDGDHYVQQKLGNLASAFQVLHGTVPVPNL